MKNGLDDIQCYKWYIDYGNCPIDIKRIGGKIVGNTFVHKVFSGDACVTLMLCDLFDSREMALHTLEKEVYRKDKLAEYFKECLKSIQEQS